MTKVLAFIVHFLLLSHLSFIPTVSASKQKQNKVRPSDIKILHKKAPELNTKVLKLAAQAYNHVYDENKVRKPILTVIDYSRPSSEQRMWIFDINHDKLLYKTYVAHGKNSGNRVFTSLF